MALFGTDGIRAPFGRYPLDQPTVTALGFHLGRLLGATTDGRPAVLLGGDTRDSTPTLCEWLGDGLAAGGAEARLLGTVPTPAVAHLVVTSEAAAGIAVSASHNRYPDNGIKLFDAGGLKWSPEREAELETLLRESPPAVGGHYGIDARESVGRYLEHLVSSLGGDEPLAGLAIVADAANGATSELAGELLGRLGAAVEVLFASPDGRNINQGCGSTHPQALAAEVGRRGADLGIAFDGDGDRALLVDERGEVRDGDAMLYLWATELAAEGRLPGMRIVATSMSNLGLERALAAHGVGVERCDVGDRAVVATMLREGLVLGGEQSGHIVNSRLGTTGDGMLTAIHLAAIRRRRDRPLSELLAGFERFPQLLRNVPVSRKPPFEELPKVAALVEKVESELGDSGRLVLRYSGTEPLARIMMEGPEIERLESLAGELAAALERAVGRTGSQAS